MVSIYNAGFLYCRRINVCSLVRISETVLLKHGSCSYCSTVPNEKLLLTNDTNESKEKAEADARRKTIEEKLSLDSLHKFLSDRNRRETSAKAKKRTKKNRPESTFSEYDNAIWSKTEKERVLRIQEEWIKNYKRKEKGGTDFTDMQDKRLFKGENTNKDIEVKKLDKAGKIRDTFVGAGVAPVTRFSWLNKIRAFKGQMEPLLGKKKHESIGSEKYKVYLNIFKTSAKPDVSKNLRLSSIHLIQELFDYTSVNSDKVEKLDWSPSMGGFGDTANRQLAGEIDTNTIPGPSLSNSINSFENTVSGGQVGSKFSAHGINGADMQRDKSSSSDLSPMNNTTRPGSSTMMPAQAKDILKEIQKTSHRNFGSSTEEHQRERQEHFTSYIDVSISTGLFAAALENFKRQTKADGNCALQPTLAMYNLLLRGVASTKGSQAMLMNVLGHMEEYGIKPNLESFAYCMIFLGDHMKTADKFGPIMLKQMKEQGIDFSNVFVECDLTVREADCLIKVMRRLQPDLVLKPKHQHLLFTEPVTKGLNTAPTKTKQTEYPSQVKLEKVMENVKVQVSREIGEYVEIPSVWEDHRKTTATEEQKQELFKKWKRQIEEGWRKRLHEVKQRFILKGQAKTELYPYLILFNESEYIDILLKEAIYLSGLNAYYSPVVKSEATVLGSNVYRKYKMLVNLNSSSYKAVSQCYKAYLTKMINQPHQNHRQNWVKLLTSHCPYTSMNLEPYPWSLSLQKTVGMHLLNILMDNVTIKMDNGMEQNCFFAISRNRGTYTSTEIQPNPVLQKYRNPTILPPIANLPMLCPPLPLYSEPVGGQLIKTEMLLTKENIEQSQWLKKIKPVAVYDALNILSNTAWVVNKPVLDVVIHLFNSGGAPEIAIPVHPDNVVFEEEPEGTSQMKIKFKRNKKLDEANSLWFSELYKYSMANMFRDEVFWMPCFLDFRGRSYPFSLFSHQSNDVVRGLFKFATAKPLGEEGLKWLKIHLVNLTELKKRSSMQERYDFIDEIMPEVEDSADNPITGRRWWMKFDNAVQLLAACMELMAALRSPDPVAFCSNFPLHQDGSCNGLQHYAALGRDVEGSKYVNLYPLDKPSDVYSNVKEMIGKQIDTEVTEMKEVVKSCKNKIQKKELTHELKTKQYAQKYLDRKVIKQSVMTQVYGVSFVGVNGQIRRQIGYTDCPEEFIFPVSLYLSGKTFQSLAKLFKAGKDIEAWFNSCSQAIAFSGMPVVWVTPLGFPVKQLYYKKDGKKSQLNKLKQRSAFTPNIIHSLDATHMMLTALHCYRDGIAFSSIHDCFWTHACDVSVMNRVTREQFVALYKEPVLEDLSQFFQDYYGDWIQEFYENFPLKHQKSMQKFKAVPEKGDFDINLVKESVYFFS